MTFKSRYSQIGIDRIIRYQWLEKTAKYVLAGNKVPEIKAMLQNELSDKFQSSRIEVRGSLDKTITILMKIWLTVPADIKLFQMQGLKLLKLITPQNRLVVHWGMVMAVYPFWSSVATQVGRSLKLQGKATAVHVQRRTREQYGERETVSRRTRYVLRSFLDWGILQETGSQGIYSAGAILSIDDPRLIAWLVEASLRARENGSATLRDLLENPSFFPFQIKPIHAESISAASSRLEILNHGLDDTLVILKKSLTNGKEN